MITTILFILIGIKLNILKGWYLGLIIARIIILIIEFGIKCIKIGKDEIN